MSRMRRLAGAALALAGLGLAPAAAAGAVDSEELRTEVTLGGMIEHEQKFQAIANAHQNNRAAATVGYEQSVDYVAERLDDAGYDVHLSPFDYPTWEENTAPVMQQVSPTPTDYVPGGPEDDDSPAVDFITFEFSASGDVTAPVVPTNDIVIPPDPDESTSTSGCEPADFPAETAGAIALIQRGVCPFVQKLDNAEAAGAAGVILFNEGQVGRTSALYRGASPYFAIPAVFSSFEVGEELYESFNAGEEPTVRIKVDASTIARVQHNVIADSPWGEGRSVLVGGHLDSVPEGPGINDNGSGVAAILETAEELAELHARAEEGVAAAQAKRDEAADEVAKREAKLDKRKRQLRKAKRKVRDAKRKLAQADDEGSERKAERKLKRAKRKKGKAKDRKRRAKDKLAEAEAELAKAEEELTAAKQRFAPRQRLRIGFWGAEEAGLIGSTQYVDQLTAAEREQILLNLNFDMLGSPNFVRFVYDGNTDETEPPPDGAPPGSDVIEQVFLDYFASQGLATEPTAFDGRSDYGPFIAQGIPAGGLFSGAEVPKTPEQAAVYGGIAGEPYDPCYHESCDTYDSVFGAGPPGLPGLAGNGAVSLDQMADAVAHATLHFLSEEAPLGAAATAKRPRGERAYRLPFRGPERTVQR